MAASVLQVSDRIGLPISMSKGYFGRVVNFIQNVLLNKVASKLYPSGAYSATPVSVADLIDI